MTEKYELLAGFLKGNEEALYSISCFLFSLYIKELIYIKLVMTSENPSELPVPRITY